ncbi:EVE domain-containing protein [Azotobacter chroococcum subsp. isscasi]|uniref:EVE domain-containing protein n=1 Tax=Azotobacter chroococcum TaxID=353 RepID=UPI00103CC930|nr:EVE domain-containing protein [Azotobacter chroococcum]TBW06992.1 EVE domain-containing protein [Azotobacter chroococcum subsp. isscasi]
MTGIRAASLAVLADESRTRRALSAATLQRLRQARWDGVRNYPARDFLRNMRADELFLYHSSCPRPGIAGIGRIVRTPVRIPAPRPARPLLRRQGQHGEEPVERSRCGVRRDLQRHHHRAGSLRSIAELAQLPLLQKGSRLSVMPAEAGEWTAVLALR